MINGKNLKTKLLHQNVCFYLFLSRIELMEFAVTYCTPDMIEPILQTKALLETQVEFSSLTFTKIR